MGTVRKNRNKTHCVSDGVECGNVIDLACKTPSGREKRARTHNVRNPTRARGMDIVPDPAWTTYICFEIFGALVRLPNCKRLTNSLPKKCLTAPPPPPPLETAGYQVGPICGWTCHFSRGFTSWVYGWEHFSSSTWGTSDKVYYYCGRWDSNLHHPNETYYVDDAIY